MQPERVVVAMSGGVDSSVAAALLVEAGLDVVGLFMRLGHEPAPGVERSRGCCSARDADDARRVAGRLGIPFYSLDFEAEFGRIVDDFVGEYARARTPNPCVRCNQWLKFGRLVEISRDLDATSVATGHYVRRTDDGGRPGLARAADRSKDQSYYLFALTPEQLAWSRFPLGDWTKDRVRDHARRLGLATADKPESQDVCFVPGGDYRRVLAARRPEILREGQVEDTDGRPVGTHPGVAAFTIGQRRGLGVALGRPAYVVDLDPYTNTVVVGSREDLLRPGLVAADVHWIAPAQLERRCLVQIRYRHEPVPATVRAESPGRAVVHFDEPQPAVTPGQAAVFYEAERLLGGGWIERAIR